MPVEVILPRVDMDMTEAILAQWLVAEGETVKQGDIIFEIETTKSNMEVESPASGTLRYISAEEGQEFPVGTTLAWIYSEGEDDIPPPNSADVEELQAVSSQSISAEPATVIDSGQDEVSIPVPAVDGTDVIRATPKARMLARQACIDLMSVQGSGPGGRVEAADIACDSQIPVDTLLTSVWLREGSDTVPLVLIHGFGADHSSWQPLVNGLRSVVPKLPILAVDLPLHGRSAAINASGFSEMVELLKRTLKGLGISACHLMGHSLGGAVALEFASHSLSVGATTKVESLCLLAPAGLGPEIHRGFVDGMLNSTKREAFIPWLKLLVSDQSLLDSRFIDAVAEPMLDDKVRQSRVKLISDCFVDGAQLQDLRSCLDKLEIPVKVIWGVEDRIIPVQHADHLAGHIAVHRFAGCGHLPQLEAKNGVIRLLGEILR